jgi:uncharacterized protein
MNMTTVRIEKPADMNFILGHAHFIKTVEDVYEAIVQTNPAMKFGVAFCEASGPCLVRSAGNDDRLVQIAQQNAMALAAVNILNTIKNVPEVCRIHCATANPTEVIIAETEQGRAILGVVDGEKPREIETEADVVKRKEFLRMIGYKF